MAAPRPSAAATIAAEGLPLARVYPHIETQNLRRGESAMLRILLLSIAALATVAPVVHADQGNPSPGHRMEAQMLGLNPQVFTRTDIAQITSEFTWTGRVERVKYILEMKQRRGEDVSNPFAPGGPFLSGGGDLARD